LLLNLGYRVRELVQIGFEGAQEAPEGMPAGATVPVLELGDVRDADAGAGSHLILFQPGLAAQFPQRSAEDAVVLGVVGFASGHCNCG
jgi:hypothetical protein